MRVFRHRRFRPERSRVYVAGCALAAIRGGRRSAKRVESVLRGSLVAMPYLESHPASGFPRGRMSDRVLN